MPRYALLLRSNGNRVFGEASFGLAQAELDLFDEGALDHVISRQERAGVAGVDYLVVDAVEALSGPRLAVLSHLSSLHALYEIEPDGRFRPVAVAPRLVLDEDLVTIQRYVGKTNEALTHLLVNAALAAAVDGFGRLLRGDRLRLLDPLCGRGSSLNRAALYGMDAVGVEIDRRAVEAYDLFLSTWLQDKRMKHKVERATLRKGRERPAHRVTIAYGDRLDPDVQRLVDVIHDDSVSVRDHVRVRSADLLVCDLPYGVQHGSRPEADHLRRSPEGLLEAALPAWFDVLRPGAGAAVAWNRRTLSRARLVALLGDAGFAVRRADDESFVHRVDRSITRDVVVATRPVG